MAEGGASGHPAGLCIAAAAHRGHRGVLGCAAIVSCCSCSTGICNLGFVVPLPHSSTAGRPSIVAAYTAGPTAAPRRPPTPLQVIGLRPRSRSRSPTVDDTRGRQRATGGRARCARRGGDERADTGFSADRAASTGVAGNHRCAATCRCSCCSPGSSKVDYAAAADAGLRLPVRAWAVAAADDEGVGCHRK